MHKVKLRAEKGQIKQVKERTNLGNDQSAYTPQMSSIYLQVLFASHTSQYLNPCPQQHARSHQPVMPAA